MLAKKYNMSLDSDKDVIRLAYMLCDEEAEGLRNVLSIENM